MILFIVQFALGQQTQEGVPYSQIHGLSNSYHTITLPQIKQDELLEEDTFREMGTPYRYGFKHEGNYSSENFGIWEETIDGGMMWQIGFISEDAYAISFEYEHFYIPEGGEMFEVTYEGEVVWEHQADGIFRAQKYGYDYL